ICVCVCVCVYVNISGQYLANNIWPRGTVAQVLALPPHSKMVMGSIPAWLMALGGRSSGGLSPGPFSVEFACSPCVHKGFLSQRTPTEKTCKKNRTLLSVPDQDGRF